MNEKVTKFYEALSADSALKDELQAVTDGIELHVEVEGRADLAKAIADFATAHGFDLTADDLLVEPASEGELSEDELAVVAGGWEHRKRHLHAEASARTVRSMGATLSVGRALPGGNLLLEENAKTASRFLSKETAAPKRG